MQGLRAVDFSDPVIVLIGSGIVLMGSLALALMLMVRGRRRADPLEGLFSPDRLSAEIEAVERRAHFHKTRQQPRGSLLRAQIDHLRQIRTLWGHEAHAEAVMATAQVMRAGVRKSDVVNHAQDPDGESTFEILAHGASERDAGEIAKRLRRAISRRRISGMGDTMRLTASFGVASRRFGESEAAWRARADAALQAAHAWGRDQVVTASDWEEVLLLPPPENAAKDEAEGSTRAA